MSTFLNFKLFQLSKHQMFAIVTNHFVLSASLADLVQSHSAIQNIQQSTIEDFDDSLTSDEEEMEFADQEIQSRSVNECSSSNGKHPSGVESVQGNGAFSLVTKQRFFLSMFMFAFMFLGPGNLLFGARNSMFYIIYF